MKLSSLCSLYSKLCSHSLLYKKLKKLDPTIFVSNKNLASDNSLNVVVGNGERFKQCGNGQRIIQNYQNFVGRTKYNGLVDFKYTYLHNMMAEKEITRTISPQFFNDFISNHLKKGLFMINPEVFSSNLLNYLEENRAFLIYNIFGVQSKCYKLMEEWDNFCDLFYGHHWPLLQVETCLISYSLSKMPVNCLPYLPQDQETLLYKSISTGKGYTKNQQVPTDSKMPYQLSAKQNYSCGNCQQPLEKKPATDESKTDEKENHDGLLTCGKGGQSSDSSADSGEQNDEGLLTCRKVGQIADAEKVAEERIEKVQKRQQLQGTWTDLCRRSQPTKDSVTLARTPPWRRFINWLLGVRMEDRLQKYRGNSPAPFVRKSLAERRIELGVDSSKPLASWACKGKRKKKPKDNCTENNK